MEETGVRTTDMVERIDLPSDRIPSRWFNALPVLPRALDRYIDNATGEKASDEYLASLFSRPVVAQESSLERWVGIPDAVRQAYKIWRPTPLIRAVALERYLDTPAEIYFKYEATAPTGSHKLNSALAQAYYAKREGLKRLVTDTGAGQWGSAAALACQLMGIELLVFMSRASHDQKPYRRYLMEMYGAEVRPSPSTTTEFGRSVLGQNPDHPGNEAISASEALEVVLGDDRSRFCVGAFTNHCLLHQTVIGLEAREQLEEIDREADFLVASVGCGSNLGGLVLPWIEDKLNGAEVELIAAEPEACATLTHGEYRLDYSDASGKGPSVYTYTLGHEFTPPPIHAGGLRYHGAAPLIGLLRHEGLLDARAYSQAEVFDAGVTFARLHGYVPAPETCHAIRAVIDVARRCREEDRRATIVFCYSGHGLLDLEAYSAHRAGALEEDGALATAGGSPAPAIA
jgi:tryptophan synthase beta chain